MDDLSTVYGVPDTFGTENGCQKPESIAVYRLVCNIPEDTSISRNVWMKFLPVNTTLFLQPVDRVVISSLTHKYHWHLV
jgi:hypothetical protein